MQGNTLTPGTPLVPCCYSDSAHSPGQKAVTSAASGPATAPRLSPASSAGVVSSGLRRLIDPKSGRVVMGSSSPPVLNYLPTPPALHPDLSVHPFGPTAGAEAEQGRHTPGGRTSLRGSCAGVLRSWGRPLPVPAVDTGGAQVSPMGPGTVQRGAPRAPSSLPNANQVQAGAERRRRGGLAL